MSLKHPFVALASTLLVGVACASQGEGERCDTNNGNDDCESGLICRPSSQLASRPAEGTLQQSGQNQTLGLCCPQGSTAITNPACYPNTTPVGTGGSSATGGRDSGAAGDSGVKGTGGGAGAGGAVSTGGTTPTDAASKGGG